jgi:hydroxymethylpyrimidine/phosphomethylpyrimidine kinase
MRTALTIAGSDSSAGAGIQADLKTFAAHGVYGTTAITAVTAQNTTGVTAVAALDPSIVVAQIDAVISDLGADAVKIGMLANAAIARAVGEAIVRLRLGPIVLDPVLVAKGGDRLVDDEGLEVVRSVLVPLSAVVTPNLEEARALTGLDLHGVDDMRRAARMLVDLGAAAAIVKGGHLPGPAIDVLFDGHAFVELRADRIDTRHTHGTGCTFSSAIAARLALGDDVVAAARAAKAYVTRAIAAAPGLGRGAGPLGHL